MKTRLYQCETFDQQKKWCADRLMDGCTLTDPQIFLGGANPDRIIRALRKDGMDIRTVYVKTIDAAGRVHKKTLAWRLNGDE